MDLELASLPALERYKLIIGLVIPRPIGWVSTWNENGVANCAPFSFFNAISETRRCASSASTCAATAR
jgi:flavin reductase (DIM6/NTAB) family NADH-FMN oxidoreductase RutF